MIQNGDKDGYFSCDSYFERIRSKYFDLRIADFLLEKTTLNLHRARLLLIPENGTTKRPVVVSIGTSTRIIALTVLCMKKSI